MKSMIPTTIAASGQPSARPNYDLTARLRRIGDSSIESIAAVATYDAGFAVKLSSCIGTEAAEALLGQWLNQRVAALVRIQSEMRRTWEASR